MRLSALCTAALLALCPLVARSDANPNMTVAGDYLEVRTCDVYTGPCVANGEMGVTGKEAVLVWAVREGQWNGVDIAGLNVIAVLETKETLGDMSYMPVSGKALLIVDEKATALQREALADYARAKSGDLISEVVRVVASPIEAAIGECEAMGCAAVTAGDMIEISTRCIGGNDHLCGNEEVFYPPLTEVSNAVPAYASVARFDGEGLKAKWEASGGRNVFLATFRG